MGEIESPLDRKMTPERWRRIDDLYHAAMEQTPAFRGQFLEQGCRGDEALRREVESLLAAGGGDEGQLDRPAWDGAASLLETAAVPVPLAAGERLGVYEILAPLGTGGMGEVYRALDHKLDREVALKILPKALGRYPDRIERLKREARILAALNHPNIAAVYDLQEVDGNCFVALELVPGTTLAGLLSRGSLAVREALSICRQVAEALEAAHERGVIHRDLKPANIMVTPEGRVKLLDFGIAKTDIGSEHAETVTRTQLTASGMIVGTVAYMSPEQARGLSLDRRSDIWSFGCVLYEALARRRLFAGPTAPDTVAAILRDDVKLDGLPEATPAGVRRLLQRCLRQIPSQRLRDIGDARIEIDDMLSGTTVETTAAVAPVLRKRRRLSLALMVLAIPAMLAAGFVVRGRLDAGHASAPVFHQLTFRRGTVTNGRFSQDGKTIVYSAAWDGKDMEIFTIRADGPESRAVGLPSGGLLAISPRDELAMTVGCEFNVGLCQGTLARVPLAGGAPKSLIENVFFAEWSHTDELAVALAAEGRFRLEYPIGKVLYETTGWIDNPRFSPKGDRIAFIDHPRLSDISGSVAVVDLARKKTTLTPVMRGALGLAWAPSGDEIWYSGDETGDWLALHAVKLSGERRVVLRSPSEVHIDDISTDGRVLLDRTSPSARLVVANGKQVRELMWFSWSASADISADGKSLLFFESGPGTRRIPVTYLRPTGGGDAIRLGEGRPLALSPNGKYAIAVRDGSPESLVLLPTGAGEPRTLPGGSAVEYYSASWFPDGERILFVAEGKDRIPQSFMQSIDGGNPQSIATSGMMAVLVSPDGKRVAAIGPDNGFYIFPVDGGAASAVRGLEPGDMPIQWSANGRSLYARAPGDAVVKIVRIDLATGRRDQWRELPIPDPVASMGIGGERTAVRITPDGNTCVFTYWTGLGELYLAEGLK